MASGGEYTATKLGGCEEGRGEAEKRRKGKERSKREKGRAALPLPRYSPAQGGSLLPALDQDSLEREARISIWGIGRNV